MNQGVTGESSKCTGFRIKCSSAETLHRPIVSRLEELTNFHYTGDSPPFCLTSTISRFVPPDFARVEHCKCQQEGSGEENTEYAKTAQRGGGSTLFCATGTIIWRCSWQESIVLSSHSGSFSLQKMHCLNWMHILILELEFINPSTKAICRIILQRWITPNENEVGRREINTESHNESHFENKQVSILKISCDRIQWKQRGRSRFDGVKNCKREECHTRS